jgi:hypothetical protein
VCVDPSSVYGVYSNNVLTLLYDESALAGATVWSIWSYYTLTTQYKYLGRPIPAIVPYMLFVPLVIYFIGMHISCGLLIGTGRAQWAAVDTTIWAASILSISIVAIGSYFQLRAMIRTLMIDQSTMPNTFDLKYWRNGMTRLTIFAFMGSIVVVLSIVTGINGSIADSWAKFGTSFVHLHDTIPMDMYGAYDMWK